MFSCTFSVDREFEVVMAEIGEMDHIHIFASAHPKISPSYIVKMLKGISGRLQFINSTFPVAKNKAICIKK